LHTATFGVRIYRREAMLVNHVDRADTHLASAVMQIGQECDANGDKTIDIHEFCVAVRGGGRLWLAQQQHAAWQPSQPATRGLTKTEEWFGDAV